MKPRIAAVVQKLLRLLVVCEQRAKDDLVANPLDAVDQKRHKESDERQKWQ